MHLERILELTDELTLLGREMYRRLDYHATEKTPAWSAADRPPALVTQPEHATRLAFGRNFECHISLERRHVDRAAECGGGEAHRNLTAEVYAIALEDRMLANVDLHVEIPRGTAVASRLALAPETYPVPGVKPPGDFDPHGAGAPPPPLPVARSAGVAHEGAGTAAPRAGLLQLEETLGNADLAGAAAGLTGSGGAALGGAAAVAHLALGEPLQLDLYLVPEYRL